MALLRTVADRFGRLDVLVNNAGTFAERDFAAGKNPNATLDDEVALNLTAPIHLTGEVLERWPSPDVIAFFTSGFALVSPTRAPTYGAVKAGLHGLQTVCAVSSRRTVARTFSKFFRRPRTRL